jgi:hypothetical protein
LVSQLLVESFFSNQLALMLPTQSSNNLTLAVSTESFLPESSVNFLSLPVVPPDLVSTSPQFFEVDDIFDYLSVSMSKCFD